MKQPTQDSRKICVKKILVTEISLVGCSKHEFFNNPSLPQIIIYSLLHPYY
jgi:hypothetical protein